MIRNFDAAATNHRARVLWQCFGCFQYSVRLQIRRDASSYVH
jgi:hypothetical protein